MKRRCFAAFAAMVLILALAVPAGAAGYDVEMGYDDGGLLTPLIIGVGVAALICWALVSLQKDVHKKNGASDYITEEGVRITQASDRFTHTTQTRRKLQNNNNRK